MGAQSGGGAAGGRQVETGAGQIAGDGDERLFVRILHRDEDPPFGRQMGAGADLAFREGFGEGGVDAHDLAGGFHLRAEDDVDPGEAREREDRFLDRDMFSLAGGQVEVGELFASHHAGRNFRHRHAGGFGDEGHGAAGPRIDFQQKDMAVLNRELNVHQADDVETLGQLFGLPAQVVQGRRVQRLGRQGTGAVAGMDAGFFDMFHDAGDFDRLAVADRVDVDFDGVTQETVDEHRVIAGSLDGGGHIAA